MIKSNYSPVLEIVKPVAASPLTSFLLPKQTLIQQLDAGERHCSIAIPDKPLIQDSLRSIFLKKFVLLNESVCLFTLFKGLYLNKNLTCCNFDLIVIFNTA